MSLHNKKINFNNNMIYDRIYYEDGVKNGVSGYENYHWMPTRSIPEAIEIKNRFNFSSCVDFGCAKGFLVHALRLLNCNAYGEDISEYALQNCHPSVANYVSLPNNKKYELLICKDVLEHVSVEDLPNMLNIINKKADKFFFVIPLGDDDKFRIREYEMDITHVTKKDEQWWIEMFNKHNFKLEEFSYSFGSVKEKWYKNYPYGNGFFILTKKS